MNILRLWTYTIGSMCFAFLCSVPAPIMAQTEACRADFAKFCSDVSPGGGRIIKCLQDHEAELSLECKTTMAASGRLSKPHTACAKEHDTWCAGLTGAQDAACLGSHKDALSAECKAELVK